jgi:hypothetical protein
MILVPVSIYCGRNCQSAACEKTVTSTMRTFEPLRTDVDLVDVVFDAGPFFCRSGFATQPVDLCPKCNGDRENRIPPYSAANCFRLAGPTFIPLSTVVRRFARGDGNETNMAPIR